MANDKEIKIKDIYLSKQNPRYTSIKSLDENLATTITKDYIEMQDKEKELETDQKEIISNILSWEGDYKDLYSLISSIESIGFETAGDEPVLIEMSNGKFVVAEGNRRMSILKIIEDPSLINDLKENEIDTSEIDPLNDDDGRTTKKTKKTKKDYIKAIKESIGKMDKNKYSLFENNFKIFEYEKIKYSGKDKDLWSIIYSKHISGDRPGLRKWSRSKYFLDIINIFESNGGIDFQEDNEFLNKCLKQLKRDKATLQQDIQYALFVKDIFIAQFGEDKWRDQMNNYKVSALQQNFSLERVEQAYDDIYEYVSKSEKKEFSNIFKIVFKDKDKSKISYEGEWGSNNDKKKQFLKFIYHWWKEEKVITTRPIIDDDKKESFCHALKFLLEIKNTTDQELLSMDLIDLPTREQEKIYERIKDSDNFTEGFKVKIKIMIDLGTELRKNYELIRDNVPNDLIVFRELNNQYHHNFNYKNTGTTFLNAMAVSIRSMLEQFLILGASFHRKSIVKGMKASRLKNSDKAQIINDNWKEIISRIENMSDQDDYFTEWMNIIWSSDDKKKLNGSKFTNEIRTHFTDKKNEDEFNKFLMNFTNLKPEDLDFILIKDFFLKNMVQEIGLINEIIHSKHQLKFTNSTTSLELVIRWQKMLYKIISNLNMDKLNKIAAAGREIKERQMVEYLKEEEESLKENTIKH